MEGGRRREEWKKFSSSAGAWGIGMAGVRAPWVAPSRWIRVLEGIEAVGPSSGPAAVG